MASSSHQTAQATRPELATVPAAVHQAQISLILGVASCVPAIGVLFCIPAIIYGHLGLSRARRAAQPADIRIMVSLVLGYVIAVIYLWMAIGLFVVPALSGR